MAEKRRWRPPLPSTVALVVMTLALLKDEKVRAVIYSVRKSTLGATYISASKDIL